MSQNISISIERAEMSDAVALSEFGARTFTEKFGHLYKPEDLQAFLDEDHCLAAYEKTLGSPDYAVWKAVASDGALAGYAVAGVYSMSVGKPLPGAMEIKRLYVDSQFQSAGLGARLMDEMLNWIERDGPLPIYLSVYKYNDGAQRFYHRYGFSLEEEIVFYVGQHADPEYLFSRIPG